MFSMSALSSSSANSHSFSNVPSKPSSSEDSFRRLPKEVRQHIFQYVENPTIARVSKEWNSDWNSMEKRISKQALQQILEKENIPDDTLLKNEERITTSGKKHSDSLRLQGLFKEQNERAENLGFPIQRPNGTFFERYAHPQRKIHIIDQTENWGKRISSLGFTTLIFAFSYFGVALKLRDWLSAFLPYENSNPDIIGMLGFGFYLGVGSNFVAPQGLSLKVILAVTSILAIPKALFSTILSKPFFAFPDLIPIISLGLGLRMGSTLGILLKEKVCASTGRYLGKFWCHIETMTESVMRVGKRALATLSIG